MFTVESSRIYAVTGHANDRPVGYAHFQVYNSYLEGSESGGWAHNKVIIDGSYVTTEGISEHQSGMRTLKNSTLRDSTFFCTPFPEADENNDSIPDPDGGCSSDGNFYREFGVPVNTTVEHNYFKRNPTGPGQYFAIRWTDCHLNNDCINNQVTGNLFDLGQGTDGGEFPNDSGDVWSDNWWTDGVPALVDQVR